MSEVSRWNVKSLIDHNPLSTSFMLQFNRSKHSRRVGFTIKAICYGLTDMRNWKWFRESREQMFAIGPLRVSFSVMRIWPTCSPDG